MLTVDIDLSALPRRDFELCQRAQALGLPSSMHSSSNTEVVAFLREQRRSADLGAGRTAPRLLPSAEKTGTTTSSTTTSTALSHSKVESAEKEKQKPKLKPQPTPAAVPSLVLLCPDQGVYHRPPIPSLLAHLERNRSWSVCLPPLLPLAAQVPLLTRRCACHQIRQTPRPRHWSPRPSTRSRGTLQSRTVNQTRPTHRHSGWI
jgi:hypothetical protein